VDIIRLMAITTEKLKSKLSNLPKKPGVYQFVNKDGEVIYVGKAKNLRSRVGQYFQNHDNRPQLPFLMAEATDFSYTVVSNELESLFLEATLIKKFLPRYNIMLRDDKNYAFIKIDFSAEIPQIGYARKVEIKSQVPNNKNQINSKNQDSKPNPYNLKPNIYFGPYSAAYKIRNTLQLMRRIFPYCAAEKVSSRPCFYYYLHRCPGVCIGKVSLEEYKKYINEKICAFLAGDTTKIKRQLEQEMKLAASRQEFEKAARLRDQCNALELLEERQSVILPKAVSWDLISIGTDSGYACVNLFKVREGKLKDKENFVYEITNTDILNGRGSTESYGSEVLQTFCEKYYLETSDVPKSIYLQNEIEDSELITHIVSSRFNRKTEIVRPQKNKPAELIKMGALNAEEYLKKWLSDQAGHLDKINSALTQLKETLNLSQIPKRIECYDISNIQGTNPVGSMVVFTDGLPNKSQYRKFKIQGKNTPDDFAMMKEMLTRRLARSLSDGKNQNPKTKNQTDSNSWPLPDLIVIDGGKGQLSAAMETLEKLQMTNSKFQIIGLAKRIEEIFLPNNPIPIILGHDQPALQLLQRLRDEAHRFGITFHRQLRSKQAVKSALDDIPGLGPKTKKLLKEKFGTVASIKKAEIDDLAKVVGEKLALTIKKLL
jgi:excinuclease ABC subunit C